MLLIDKIAIAAIIAGILVFTGCIIALDRYRILTKEEKTKRNFH